MPLLRTGRSKEKRSYLDKDRGGVYATEQQLERRNLVRDRLFRDDILDDESDDFFKQAAIGGRRSRSVTRTKSTDSAVVHDNDTFVVKSGGRKEKRRSRSANGLIDMRQSLLRRVSGLNHNFTPPPSPGNNNALSKKKKKKDNKNSSYSPPRPLKRDKKKEKKQRRTKSAPEPGEKSKRRRSRSETRGPINSSGGKIEKAGRARSTSLSKLRKGMVRRISGGGNTPPTSPPKRDKTDSEIFSNALKRVQDRKAQKATTAMPRRVSRSLSPERPATPVRKDKRRSRSVAGLAEMRKSLMMRRGSVTKVGLTPPHSPKGGASPDDVKSSKSFSPAVPPRSRRQTRIMKREFYMETLMIEDDGGAGLGYSDSESENPDDPKEAERSFLYRGLQVLEKLYLE